MAPLSTFSIVAFDPELEAWGVAVASKFPAVGAVGPWAQAGAGALATQAFANTSYGPQGLAALATGLSAQKTLQDLIEADQGRASRQVGLVDASGGAATYTGDDCNDWAGCTTGEGYAAQGNILTGPEVIEAMAAAFEASSASLPDRLLAALLAGDQTGGDRRGRQSAALLVVRQQAGYGGFNDRWLDYRVDDHEDPVPRLIELVDLHELYFGESPPEDKVPLADEVLEELQRIMTKQGYFKGESDGELTDQTRRALRAFIGNENFEERVNLETGLIDRPVFEFLLRKHSN